jgi:hypothetical protein
MRWGRSYGDWPRGREGDCGVEVKELGEGAYLCGHDKGFFEKEDQPAGGERASLDLCE